MWLNRDKTLLENRNKDTWQLPVVDVDYNYLGNVIGQIVEPEEYMVRYFLIYDPNQQRRYLLPSDTVFAIEDKIYSTVDITQIAQFPSYSQDIERDDECKIYEIISQKPYWTKGYS